MKQIESLQDFYNTLPEGIQSPLSADSNLIGHFNVFPRWNCKGSYQRRDFYKIVLLIGSGILTYGNEQIKIDRPALFITNPLMPYSWEAISEKQEGWICVFTEGFINSENLNIYPILAVQKTPVYFPDEESFGALSDTFQKMMQEMNTDYIYKYSLLQNYLLLLIHQIQKLSSNSTLENQPLDAAHRTTILFLELLEQQFPINSPSDPLSLRSAGDYAQKLAIHINHLNHSVKKVTNKTSSQLITSRIIREAKALLQNSDWNITEISDALGFEYPSHFTNFFRKQTGVSPKEFR